MANLNAILCAENVALLSLLSPVPARPSKSPVVCPQGRLEGYTLPFESERKLCYTLAFLSSITESTKHITAVSIRENKEAGTLDVLLAVNQTSHKDGSSLVVKLEQGFRSLFSLVSEFNAGKSSEGKLAAPTECS